MRRIRSFLLSPEDNPGGGGSSGNETPTEPVVAANPPAPSNKPADPPATKVVIEGTKTESDLALAQQLEAEKAARKKEQTRISELENENHELKKIPKDKPKKAKGPMAEFFGWED